jgi:Tfp pilus assembly protein PilN
VAEFDLNLSTRPFPAYRLINVALAGILTALFVLSVWQTIGFTRFSKLSRAIRAAEIDARIEAETLGKRVAEFESRLDRPEAAAKLNEIGFLNHLIARKNLSWTRLLADLEDLVPNNVHLVSLIPEIGANGGVMLQIDLQGKSITDVSEFIHRLEKSPVFQNVKVSTEQKRQSTALTDFEIRLSVVYYPEREAQ